MLSVLFALMICTHGESGVTNSMGEIMQTFPVQVAPETLQGDAAQRIIEGLARVPAPTERFANRIDPVVPAQDSCDRDTDALCPEGWMNIGPIKSGSTEYCAAGTSYMGPCTDEAQSFRGMSVGAKSRWSDECKAYFPCKVCKRNYQSVCPQAWDRVGDSLLCSPPATYKGPCRTIANFAGHNKAMLETWAELCGAFWECRQDLDFENTLSADPISKDATLSRIRFGLQ